MTFIKWAGGKTQLIPEIANLLPDMKKIRGYAEPFIGGGSIFFYLKEQGYLDGKPVYLSDLNTNLIDTYKVIRGGWKELVPLLEKLEKEHSVGGEKFFFKIRDNFPDGLDIMERAAQFIYLNKTCFNGMWRVNASGKNNIGCGHPEKNIKIFDINRLKECSMMLNGIDINIGVMSFESVVRIPDMKDYWVYLDPPYDDICKSGNFDGYTEGGFVKRHLLLTTFKRLDEMGCKVMMSNSSTPLIMNEFKNFTIKVIKAKRLIAGDGSKRGEVDELLITNYKPYSRQLNLADY